MGVTTARSPRTARDQGAAGIEERLGLLERRRFWICVAICVALGAVAATPTIAREPLGRDEIETIALVSKPIGDFLDVLPRRQNGVLFDVALWPTVHFGGDSEAWLRLPALLAFLAAIPLAAAIGRRLGGPAIGLGGAFLLAIHPFSVTFAQEGRPYTFALFFMLLATLLLLRVLENPSPSAFVAYALAAAATFYSHDLAVLALPAHLVLVAASPNKVAKRRFASVVALIAALGVPLLLFLPDDIALPLDWARPPFPAPVARTLQAMAGSWAGIPICLCVLAAGFIAYRGLGRAQRKRVIGRVELVFLAAWVAVPFILIVLISLFQPLLAPRYLLPSLPALCLLLAVSVLVVAAHPSLPSRRVIAAGFSVLIATFGVATGWTNAGFEKPDWPGAAAYLERNVEPDDWIALGGESTQNSNALLYYSDALVRGEEPPLASYEATTPRNFIRLALPHDVATLRSAATGSGVVWILDWGDGDASTRVELARVLERCTVEQRAEFREIPVYRVTGCS